MRILMIIPSYKPAYLYGGPIRSVAHLSESLVKAGHDVTVYTTNANGIDNLPVHDQQPLLVDNVKVFYFRRRTKDHTNYTPSLLGKLSETAESFDVIHIHSWWNLVTIPSVQICIRKGIRPAFSPRGSLAGYTFTHKNLRIKSLLHQLFGRTLLRHCIFLASTDKEANEIEEAVSNADIKIIPNMLELPERVHDHSGSDIFRLIYIGRIDQGKRVDFLLELMEKEFLFPVELKIVGGGDEEYVRMLKSISPDNSRIQWTGVVDGEEKWKILANADLLVLPSQSENFANVVPEALSQGTPVLISPSVGLASLISKSGLGWVVNTELSEWHQKITEIRNSTDKMVIRTEGPKWVRENFYTESLISRYEEFYQYVMVNQRLKRR